jgi:hypothetical protein
MGKNSGNDETPSPYELLEVHGFDLLAQVEEMLRHVREYQRDVQRLRARLSGGQPTSADRTQLSPVRDRLQRLRGIVTEFGGTLAEIEAIIAAG